MPAIPLWEAALPANSQWCHVAATLWRLWVTVAAVMQERLVGGGLAGDGL